MCFEIAGEGQPLSHSLERIPELSHLWCDGELLRRKCRCTCTSPVLGLTPQPALGYTPLHCAVLMKDLEIALFLVSKLGADVSARTRVYASVSMFVCIAPVFISSPHVN